MWLPVEHPPDPLSVALVAWLSDLGPVRTAACWTGTRWMTSEGDSVYPEYYRLLDEDDWPQAYKSILAHLRSR